MVWFILYIPQFVTHYFHWSNIFLARFICLFHFLLPFFGGGFKRYFIRERERGHLHEKLRTELSALVSEPLLESKGTPSTFLSYLSFFSLIYVSLSICNAKYISVYVCLCLCVCVQVP